jgi:hypothetical protein
MIFVQLAKRLPLDKSLMHGALKGSFDADMVR